jgi:hypothetical protein
MERRYLIMPKASFNKDKLHYVAIPEELFNKVQAKATSQRLYVTQFVHKVLVTELKEKAMSEASAAVSRDLGEEDDQF